MLKGALIGFGVALLTWLPPIVHFVTGPLGPLVGGFIGGSRARASAGRAVGVGLLMGLFIVAPVALLVALGSVVQGLLPQGLRDVLVFVGIGIVGYTGAMGTATGSFFTRSYGSTSSP